jgi:hypothetical protein
MSRAAVLRAHGAALGVHGDSFPATSNLLLVLKAATRTHAPGEPTRGLHERYLFVFILLHMPEQIAAPEWGFP